MDSADVTGGPAASKQHADAAALQKPLGQSDSESTRPRVSPSTVTVSDRPKGRELKSSIPHTSSTESGEGHIDAVSAATSTRRFNFGAADDGTAAGQPFHFGGTRRNSNNVKAQDVKINPTARFAFRASVDSPSPRLSVGTGGQHGCGGGTSTASQESTATLQTVADEAVSNSIGPAPKARFTFGAIGDNTQSRPSFVFGAKPSDGTFTFAASRDTKRASAAPKVRVKPSEVAVSQRTRVKEHGVKSKEMWPAEDRVPVEPVPPPSTPPPRTGAATEGVTTNVVQKSAGVGALDQVTPTYVPWVNLLHAAASGDTVRVTKTYTEWRSRKSKITGSQMTDTGELGLVLLVAIKCGHLSVAKYFLDAGVDVNEVQPRDWCNRDCCGFNERLVLQRYKLGDDEIAGATPLRLAAAVESLVMVQLLLDTGANVDECLLHIAVARCQRDIVQILLNAGAPVNAKATASRFWGECGIRGQHSPLALAASKGDLETMDLLLAANAAVDGSPGSVAPVCAAARERHWDIVLKLADLGADLTARESKHQCGILHLGFSKVRSWPAVKSYPSFDRYNSRHDEVKRPRGPPRETLRRLAALGAPLNSRDSEGRTALWIAVESLEIEYAETLISLGADPSVPDKKGWTPLHKAYEERIHGSGDLDSKERVANVLLGAGAEVNAVTTSGYTPLACALVDPGWRLRYGVASVKRLLAAGAKVCAQSVQLAAKDANSQNLILEMLLDAGGDPDAKVRNAPSPLIQVLVSCKYSSSARSAAMLLVKAGADVNAMDKSGRSALSWACEGNWDGVDNLVEMMITRGAHINAGVTSPLDLPVAVALANGSSVIVERLIRSGANLDVILLNTTTICEFVHRTLEGNQYLIRMAIEAAGLAGNSSVVHSWWRHDWLSKTWSGERLPFPTMRQWSIATHAELAPSRREAVQTLLFVANRLRGTELGLPPEMWIHILESALRWDLGPDVVPFLFEPPLS